MAIQISGTEVISNSRGLNNIASVDATTAASITAAGVGGGGTIDFTADGAISAGRHSYAVDYSQCWGLSVASRGSAQYLGLG